MNKNPFEDIIEKLKQKTLEEEAKILERNKDVDSKKLKKELEDLKEVLDKGEKESIAQAIEKIKEKLLIERIKQSVEYFSDLKEKIDKEKEFTGLFSDQFLGELKGKVKDVDFKIKIKEQTNNLDQFLDSLFGEFYKEKDTKGGKVEISIIEESKIEDFFKFLKEQSISSLIQVYESLLILVKAQEKISGNDKPVLAPYARVLIQDVLKEKLFDEDSFVSFVKKIEDFYEKEIEDIKNKLKANVPQLFQRYLGTFLLFYIVDVSSIKNLTKNVQKMKDHIKGAYETLLLELKNIKGEIDKDDEFKNSVLTSKIDEFENYKQGLFQELNTLGINIDQKKPSKPNNLINDLTGELRRLKDISFFRNYLFFRDLIDILKVYRQKKEHEIMIKNQEELENQINIGKTKLSIKKDNFSLRAFNIFTSNHYITFGLIPTKERNDFITVRFDNTRSSPITGKTLTNLTNIDSNFFQGQDIGNPEKYLFSSVVYQNDKTTPEITFKQQVVKKDEILKKILDEEIKINTDQQTILKQDGDIYLITDKLYKIYRVKGTQNEVRLFLSFILQLILLKTILDRRVFMVVRHMKSLRKTIQKSNLQEVKISDVKSYSIYKRLGKLAEQKIVIDNIEHLFKLDTFLGLKDIAQKSYKDLKELLPENNDKLNKIRQFYNLLSPLENDPLEKSWKVLSKIAIVMDEFSWSVRSSEINDRDFLRIIFNYCQMVSLLNKINQFSEIFKLFNQGVTNEEQTKKLFRSLGITAMKICEIALECQPFNLYTLRTTGGFFYKVFLRQNYNPIQGNDKIELIYKTTVDNLNFSHYEQVREHLGVSKKDIESLKGKFDYENLEGLTLEIINNISLELCQDVQLATSFYENISKMLRNLQGGPPKKPQSYIIPIDKDGKVFQEGVMGGVSALTGEKKSLIAPKNTANKDKLDEVLSRIKITTKGDHEKLLEVTFKNQKKFSVVQGEIEKVNYAEAVVNAANGGLIPGGGITRAIFNEAEIKSQLQDYLKDQQDEITEGLAVISDGFQLKQKKGINFIIHAVGPDLSEKKEIKDVISSLKIISYAVKNAISIKELITGDKNKSKINQQAIDNMKTIVIPLISGGAFSGKLGNKGYKFIIMSNLAAIFYVLSSSLETNKNLPDEVILIESKQEKVKEILPCIITLCKVANVKNTISTIKY
jgi:O-acetyl-ADP-ribose deacetylase (regulator of RNase III)